MEIFIANLDSGIEEELLTKLFEAFGPVTSTVLVRDKETRISKGYGFVIMQDAVDAQRAIDDLDGRDLAGKTLSVKPSVPKEERTPPPRRTDNFISVSFKKDAPEGVFRGTQINLEDQTEGADDSINDVHEINYTKNIEDDGLVKISFNN